MCINFTHAKWSFHSIAYIASHEFVAKVGWREWENDISFLYHPYEYRNNAIQMIMTYGDFFVSSYICMVLYEH